ncbi:hypothetical protein PUN28_018300 [Cardiocondyla obscurior]|uniref:Uncharacterized protein n=1 Tax=Cardiocondyla obscurior TaxID=286306 RepID=A0AAW2EIA3_9HYME
MRIFLDLRHVIGRSLIYGGIPRCDLTENQYRRLISSLFLNLFSLLSLSILLALPVLSIVSYNHSVNDRDCRRRESASCRNSRNLITRFLYSRGENTFLLYSCNRSTFRIVFCEENFTRLLRSHFKNDFVTDIE